ncbi:hypothetical protein Tco_1388401, partial [Tanacetum coccineum]
HMAKKCTVRKRMKDSEWFKEKMLLVESQEAGVVLNDEQQDFLAGSFEETNDYCDDKATVNAIFMANLSSIGSLNDDTSYDELPGNSNVISYTDYMLTIRNNEDNYVSPPIEKNDMILVRVLGYAVKDGHSEEEAYLNREYYTAVKDREYLTKFDECIKRRTTLSHHHIGFIAEVKEMKDIFEQMEDEENIASDITYTYLRSLIEVDNYGKCKSHDIVLLDRQESNKYFSELRKRFTKLEEYSITLDIDFQNHKEQMILNDPEMKKQLFG